VHGAARAPHSKHAAARFARTDEPNVEQDGDRVHYPGVDPGREWFSAAHRLPRRIRGADRDDNRGRAVSGFDQAETGPPPRARPPRWSTRATFVAREGGARSRVEPCLAIRTAAAPRAA